MSSLRGQYIILHSALYSYGYRFRRQKQEINAYGMGKYSYLSNEVPSETAIIFLAWLTNMKVAKAGT